MSTPAVNDEKGPGPLLQVGDWHVDATRNEVRRGGESVKLEPKVIEVLMHLARRPGQVVGREELLSAVWPGVVVGDDALTQAIIKLRKAFGDDAHRPRFIETISKRGYRLIAPVGGAKPSAASSDEAKRNPALRRRLLVIVPGVMAVIVLAAFLAFPQLLKTVGMPWPLAPDTKRGAASTAFPTVAVMPLSNLSGDPKRDYFSDGVTEDIINALGRFSGVRVMSRNAVQGFKGRVPSPQTIRNELGARYIVQGSVREADSRLRVAVELSDSHNGALLWSERYDGEGTQLFEIQDRIVKSIVSTLHVKLKQFEHERIFTKPTDSLEAHDLVLRARGLLYESDRRANREARELLARARNLSPDYAEVHTALGEAEFQRAQWGWIEDPSQGTSRAEDLAKRALSSSDTRAHARAHALLASIYSNLGRSEEALDQAERAIALNPSDSTALARRGGSLLFVGRIDEGINVLEMAKRIEPGFDGNGNLAVGYYVAGRYRDALAQADVLLTRRPRDVTMQALRTAALAQLGQEEQARQSAGQLRRLSPDFEVKHYGTRFANPEYTAKLHEGLRKAGL